VQDIMPKKMLIDATHPEETRVVVLDGQRVEDFDFESASRRQLAGNIYLAKVTRVEPSLQAAFVDYGGNRHGFLAFAEIHPDYYQIPVADRQALLAEERALAAQARAKEEAPEEGEGGGRRRDGRRGRGRALGREDDALAAQEATSEEAEQGSRALEGLSPMATVSETPVETPAAGEAEEENGVIETVEKDDTIETVAEAEDPLDLRARPEPRARRYKIQEVVKVRQIMLVQVVKEERGNKGAALTTYLSLAGRFCVLMPNTARGGGISRKITNAADRKKLKEIAAELEVPEGAGLIIRTAGAQRSKPEIRRDYDYLQRLWEQIRELTLRSVAPAKIYEEGDIIKRALRDLYSDDIDEVVVAGDDGFRNARDFMRMIMPGREKAVVPYRDPQPLFARHHVEGTLAAMFNPVVQLPSGGYIVIGVTEALVAIDVNSGRATKEGSIEQTALKTNLEAADEIARQLRLRDLAGLIVVDFIDMDERKNNAAVEKRFKERLKSDRARIQLGRISGFGLLEMSRQRLRPGMLESTTQPCPHCHGTGLLRSNESVALSILRALDEEGVRDRSKEVLVRAPVAIVNFLFNHKREHLLGIEARYGLAVRVEADAALVAPDFVVERFKTATRALPEPQPIVTADPMLMPEPEPEEPAAEPEAPAAEEATAAAGGASEEGDDRPRKRRRRRRRRDRPEGDLAGAAGLEGLGALEDDEDDDDEGDEPAAEAVLPPPAPVPVPAEVETAPRRTRVRRRAVAEPAPAAEAAAAEAAAAEPTAVESAAVESAAAKAAAAEAVAAEPTAVESAAVEAQASEPPPPRRRSRKADALPAEEAAVAPPPKPARARRARPAPSPASDAPVAASPARAEQPAIAAPAIAASEAPPPKPPAPSLPAPSLKEERAREPLGAAAEAGDRPRKRGWWSR
jgi:ribonuclease E